MTPTSAAGPEGIGLRAFNALPDGQARELLLGCCHAGRWADAVAAGRPYPTLGALLARAGEELADGDVTEALAGHPRIGAAPAAGHSSRSRQEQAGVGCAPARCLEELAAANADYERRFGHIYLVCATGRYAEELLAICNAAPERAGRERDVMRGELRAITSSPDHPDPAAGHKRPAGPTDEPVSTHVLDSVTGRPAAGVAVRLERRLGDDWQHLTSAVTDDDGRVSSMGDPSVGQNRISFDTGAYFRAQGVDTFYPEVTVVFEVTDPAQHQHVPLLLSPFAYSTYRGS